VYGGSSDVGNYTPCIANCFSPHVSSCILDGEMVGYNAETKTIGSESLVVYSTFCDIVFHMLKLERIVVDILLSLRSSDIHNLLKSSCHLAAYHGLKKFII